jgi:hypothetical protein
MSSSWAVCTPTNAPERFDHALGLANPVMVDFLRRPVLDDPGQQPGKVQNFTMCTAHRGKTGAVGEKRCEPRIDIAFIVALAFDDRPLDDCVRFRDQGRDALGSHIIQGVSYGSQAIKAAAQSHVIVVQRCRLAHV